MKRKVWEEMTMAEKLAWLDEMTENAEKRFLRNRKQDLVNAVNMKVAAGERLTVEEFERYTGIRFSHDMTGKMEDVLSLSTCCLVNPICRKRIEKKIGICAFCFSEALMLARQGVCENTAFNYRQLSKIEIPAELIPYIDAEELRIESYGDVGTVTQAANYINIARCNPHCAVTAWTKNPSIYAAAFEKLGITVCPENLTVILSSPFLNREVKIPEKYRWFIKKTFTVYTLDWLQENGKTAAFINCGGRRCKECQKCYVNANRSADSLRELLKSDAKKAEKIGFTWDDIRQELKVEITRTATDYSALFTA